jgi:hypothetical protein
VVVDAGVPVSDPRHSWTWGMDVPPRLAAVVALDCAQFDPCASATADAATALERIAAHVRRHPVEGRIDPAGTGPSRVVVDERQLAVLAWGESNPYRFALAADALDAGDPQPLLDIVEDARENPWQPHEPDRNSAGINAAGFCNDQDFVWDRSDPVALRGQKYDQALRDLDPTLFAPFSAATWTSVFVSDYCRGPLHPCRRGRSDRNRNARTHSQRPPGLRGPHTDHPRAATDLPGRHLPRGGRRVSPGRGVQRVRPRGHA